LLERVEGESLGLLCPGLANELVGREAFEGLDPLGEIVGVDEFQYGVSSGRYSEAEKMLADLEAFVACAERQLLRS
jgi:hypothetical protein